MCSVSTVSSEWTQKRWPEYWPPNAQPVRIPDILEGLNQVEISRLKAEIIQLKQQLEAARKQDIEDGSPDCQMEDKVAVIKGLAKALGVNIGDVFKGHK